MTHQTEFLVAFSFLTGIAVGSITKIFFTIAGMVTQMVYGHIPAVQEFQIYDIHFRLERLP